LKDLSFFLSFVAIVVKSRTNVVIPNGEVDVKAPKKNTFVICLCCFCFPRKKKTIATDDEIELGDIATYPPGNNNLVSANPIYNTTATTLPIQSVPSSVPSFASNPITQVTTQQDDTIQIPLTTYSIMDSAPAEPLLPPPLQKHINKNCLVLDLDETLVHSSFKPVPEADFIIPVEIENVIHQVISLSLSLSLSHFRYLFHLIVCWCCGLTELS
jgi:hypothetical protein